MSQYSLKSSHIDRRGKPRISCQYVAIVRGRNEIGEKYEENGKLCNLSATGLYFLVNRPINLGDRLFVAILLNNPSRKEEERKLAMTGIVTRKETRVNGAYGIAIRFQSYRFI